MEKLGDVHIFSSFFYSKLLCGGYEAVCRWHTKIDIFGKRLLMFPIHLDVNSHWCLAAANFVDKQITYFDSLRNDIFACLKNLRTYLTQAQQLQAKGDIMNWHTINSQCNITLLIAEYSHVSMPAIWQRIVHLTSTKWTFQSRSDPSSHTGYAYLRTPEKDERLRHLHKDNRNVLHV